MCNTYKIFLSELYLHCVSQNDPNLKRYSSKLYGLILMIFGRNILTTLEYFACISFHVGLLVITLSSLKLHTENNACMMCASVSCWARLFLQHLRRRSVWIIRDTDDRWLPHTTKNFSDCSLALRSVFLTQQQRLNCVDIVFSMRIASAATRPGRLSTVPNFTSSLMMLFFVQPLFRNFVINCRALQPLHLYTNFWSTL